MHNFGRSGGNDKVQAAVIDSDELIELGMQSKYFHNLWEIELLAFKQGPTPSPFSPPPPLPPVHCHAFGDRHSCENATRAEALRERGKDLACKWRTVDKACVHLPKEQSSAQVTDIVEVGLFGFPAFRNPNASSDGMTPHYSFTEAINRPIYTAFNHRKVDVGNPEFGHTCAVFSPDYVRNMTLIAPVDTGAWDPQCNSSLQTRFNRMRGGSGACAAENATTCNDDAPQRIDCDWRRGGCVDTSVDRQLCKNQDTEAQCGVAQGKPFDDAMFMGGKPITVKTWWDYLLQNPGCSWIGGTCHDFRCATMKTHRQCNASAQSHFNRSNPASYDEMSHPCFWDGTACAHTSPDRWCSDLRHRAEYMRGQPLPPHASAKVKCETLPQFFGGLCRYDNASGDEAGGGKCVATECADLTTQAGCERYSTRHHTVVSCAWDAAKSKCIEYGGNCSALPDHSTCVAETGCEWGASNVSHGRSVCHAGRNHHIPGIAGGEDFNCSFEHWRYTAKGDKMVLGTPTHYYHILEAGVSIWTNNRSSNNLGALMGRMAAPTEFPISSEEVFRYWEANIAGAPLYPDGIKMMVGSFGDLFGTRLGHKLREWCQQQGWVLAWALGNPANTEGQDDAQTAPYANRTLDPAVLSHTTASHNLSLASSVAGFEELWKEMAIAQNSTQPDPDDPYDPAQLNASVTFEMWRKMPADLHLDFLTGSSCSDINGCVGVRPKDGSCVCYSSEAHLAAAHHVSLKSDDGKFAVLNNTDLSGPAGSQIAIKPGRSALDCAQQCDAMAGCVAVVWNGPASTIHDGMCGFKCVATGRRDDPGEQAVIVRPNEDRCHSPPPPPPPPPLVPIPAEWMGAVNASQMLFSGLPTFQPLPLEANIGNGYVGFTLGCFRGTCGSQQLLGASMRSGGTNCVRPGVVRVAGVYNGAGTQSARAALPGVHSVYAVNAGPNGVGEVQFAGSALDLEGARFLNRSLLVACAGQVLEQRWYAHRALRSLLVHELELLPAAGNATRGPSCRIELASCNEQNTSAVDCVVRQTPEAVSRTCTTRVPESSTEDVVEVVQHFRRVPDRVVLTPGQAIKFVAAIRTSLPEEGAVASQNPAAAAASDFELAHNLSSASLRRSHDQAWNDLRRSRIEVGVASGSPNATTQGVAAAINSSYFYLLSSIRQDWPGSWGTSPGGLANSAYEGHTFWDSEEWHLPAIAPLYPELADKMLQYRSRRLGAAKIEARRAGAVGARFPLESGLTGANVCAWATGSQHEIHTTGDVAMAHRLFYRLTRNESWLREAWPVVEGCAQFWAGRMTASHNRSGQYTVLSDIGADEDAGLVNDDAYTNALAGQTLAFADRVATQLNKAPGSNWSQLAANVYLPTSTALSAGRPTHLENSAYRPRQIIEQSDVGLLQYPLDLNFSETEKRNDLEYYTR